MQRTRVRVLTALTVVIAGACSSNPGPALEAPSTTAPVTVVDGASYRNRFGPLDPDQPFCVNVHDLFERLTFTSRAGGYDRDLIVAVHDDILTVSVTAPEDIRDDLDRVANLLSQLNDIAANVEASTAESLRDADAQLDAAERAAGELAAAVDEITVTASTECS